MVESEYGEKRKPKYWPTQWETTQMLFILKVQTHIWDNFWKPFKSDEKCFFISCKKLLSFSRYYHFLSRLFGHVGKLLEKKVKVNFKIYDVTGWTANDYNTHIAQNLKK